MGEAAAPDWWPEGKVMAKRKVKAAQADWAAPRLAGLTFAFVGVDSWFEKDMKGLIKAEGGTVVQGMSPRVHYLVVGDDSPDRADYERHAKELNRRAGSSVRVLDEKGLMELPVPPRELALAMLRAGPAGLERWQSLYWGRPGRLDLSEADLRGLPLAKASLQALPLRGADLRAADLTGAVLEDCDLTGANLAGACLVEAKLWRAKLVGADLRGADLRGTECGGADITGARIEGANFEGYAVTGLDFGEDQFAHGGRVGPQVRRLAEVAGQARYLVFSAQVRFPGGKVSLAVYVPSQRETDLVMFGSSASNSPGVNSRFPSGSPTQAMIRAANAWGRGQLDLLSVKAQAQGASLRAKDLLELTWNAWCEVFGVRPPTPDELKAEARSRKQAAAAQAQELSELLRGGAQGVAAWNEALLSPGLLARDFRGLDLSYEQLKGAHFRGLDLRSANFDGAVLTGALFIDEHHYEWRDDCDLRGASFRGADLRRADLRRVRAARADFTGARLGRVRMLECDLRGASFADADLTGSSLERADVRGADFSSACLGRAKLSHATYDEQTRWPQGFQPLTARC
jgi:uncharacterized protein YjbI with pentapeptide repeats